jgi:hypothetical protein
MFKALPPTTVWSGPSLTPVRLTAFTSSESLDETGGRDGGQSEEPESEEATCELIPKELVGMTAVRWGMKPTSGTESAQARRPSDCGLAPSHRRRALGRDAVGSVLAPV